MDKKDLTMFPKLMRLKGLAFNQTRNDGKLIDPKGISGKNKD